MWNLVASKGTLDLPVKGTYKWESGDPAGPMVGLLLGELVLDAGGELSFEPEWLLLLLWWC